MELQYSYCPGLQPQKFELFLIVCNEREKLLLRREVIQDVLNFFD